MNDAPAGERERTRARWPYLLLPLAILPIAAAPAVPTQDGPSHLYNAWVLSHLSDASLPLAEHFRIVPFVPNWGGTAPLLPLLLVLPPTEAETVFHAVVVLVWVAGVLRLARRAGGDPWVAGAAGAVLAHGFPFVMGFTGYQLTAGAGMCAAAWLAGWPAAAPRQRSAWRLFVACLLFAALFFSHLAGAVVAAGLWICVGLARVLRAAPGQRLSPVALLPSTAVPLLALLQRALGAGLPDVSYRQDAWGAGQRALDLLSGGYWQALAPGDRWVGAALVALLVLAAATRRHRTATTPEERAADRLAAALASGGAAALAAYLLLPWAAAGGAFVPDRLAPLALVLPLPWAVARSRARAAAWRGAALVLLALALLVRGSEYRTWGAQQLALAGSVRPFPDGQLVLMGSRPVPPTVVDPFTHVWARVAIARRAVALDDYEARLQGLFPLAFRPRTLALAERAARDPATPPAGVVVFGWR